MSWKFSHLTEISPTADRDLGYSWPRSRLQLTEISVRRANIFLYKRIFPAEQDNFFLWIRCKKVLRNHCNNSSIIIPFTKNFKQLVFVLIYKLYIVFEYLIDKELPPNINWESSPDVFECSKTEPFLFNFMSTILNIDFSQNFPT